MDLAEINISLSEDGAAVASVPAASPSFSPLEIKVTCNTSGDKTRENVRINTERDLPCIGVMEPNTRPCVIVGGGPSLKTYWPEILMLISRGADIFALNGATQFLNDRHVLPTYQVIVDPRPENSALLGQAREYLIASQCDPHVFAQVPDDKTALFHMAGSAMGLVNGTLIGGDVTVGLVAPNLAYTMGYREIHLYGYDSSYEGAEHHAYPQGQTDQESKYLEVFARDNAGGMKKFITNFAMAKQAELFPKAMETLCEAGATIMVHGTGLIPTIAHAMRKE